MRQRLLLTGAVLTAVVLVSITACTDREVATAPAQRVLPRLAALTAGPSELSGTLTVPDPHNPTTTITLGSYSEKILATITVDGIIALTWDWGAQQGQHFADIDPFGWYLAGQSSCYVRVSVRGAGTASESFIPDPCGDISPYTSNPDVGTRPHAEAVRYLNGEVTASRNSRWFQYSSDCGFTHCWTYSGEQTVSVKPVEAELSLTPLSAFITPGGTATFTAAATPATVEYRAVPFRILSWSWAPDSGGSSAGAVCGTLAVCRPPSGPGMLTANAMVNGAPKTLMDFTIVS
jgi:hypothetical protein